MFNKGEFLKLPYGDEGDKLIDYNTALANKPAPVGIDENAVDETVLTARLQEVFS